MPYTGVTKRFEASTREAGHGVPDTDTLVDRDTVRGLEHVVVKAECGTHHPSIATDPSVVTMVC